MSDRAQPTAEDVVAAVRSILPNYPNIADFITTDLISRSVTEDWPREPPPMLYLLYMASDPAAAAHQGDQDWPRSLLESIEELISWLRSGNGVTGAWESRVRKMTALTRYQGQERFKDRYQEFQAALFELITAGQLRHDGVTVTFMPDGGCVGPDLDIVPAGEDDRPLVSVEAYAPHKGIAGWYAQYVAGPWKTVVDGPPGDPAADPENSISLEHPGIGLDVLPRALSNILTDGNFQRQKAPQLAAGTAPTLLAVRADMLTPRKYQIAPGAGRDLAAAMSADAWSCLPRKCLGLLLVMVYARAIFIPAPTLGYLEQVTKSSP